MRSRVRQGRGRQESVADPTRGALAAPGGRLLTPPRVLDERRLCVMDRDRDAAGRARNARPRDGLGRPLPYGSPGVPRQPEGVPRSPAQTLSEAQQLLDAGSPFQAHEVFEDAWKSSSEHDADLWKGLAQLAVAITHRLRGNDIGADRLFQRAAAVLKPYADAPPFGLNLAQLRAWALGPRDRAMPPLRSALPGPRHTRSSRSAP